MQHASDKKVAMSIPICCLSPVQQYNNYPAPLYSISHYVSLFTEGLKCCKLFWYLLLPSLCYLLCVSLCLSLFLCVSLCLSLCFSFFLCLLVFRSTRKVSNVVSYFDLVLFLCVTFSLCLSVSVSVFVFSVSLCFR